MSEHTPTYEELIQFIQGSKYKEAATHQDVNPINEHDAAMLILEFWFKQRIPFAKKLLINFLDSLREYEHERRANEH